MLELTPSDIQARDQLCQTLVETFAALEDAIAASNAAMQAAYETLQPHVERYNSAVQDAGEWLADLVSAMEAYQDERSEAWQDSAPARPMRHGWTRIAAWTWRRWTSRRQSLSRSRSMARKMTSWTCPSVQRRNFHRRPALGATHGTPRG